jgi:hypothetical protein
MTIFRCVFKDFIVKSEIVEKELPENKKERLDILLLNVENNEIEIINYIDRSKSIFNFIKKVNYYGLVVNILPLNKMLDFYKKINRLQKINIIENFLKS